MDRRTHIPASELAGVYNAIEFYIKYRYQEIDVEDLKVIRRLLKKIEEDYYCAYRKRSKINVHFRHKPNPNTRGNYHVHTSEAACLSRIFRS